MRKIVLAMITTLNGRLDNPAEWVTEVSSEVDIEFNRVQESCDTILIGNTTYTEMAGYWPNKDVYDTLSDVNKSLATKMNTYKKWVFTHATEKRGLDWDNAEQILVQNDEDVVRFITALKSQTGKHIHLAGGAQLAQTLIRLGLVDEYHFYVYPVVSAGVSWFDAITGNRHLELISASTYDCGVVGLYYRPQNS